MNNQAQAQAQQAQAAARQAQEAAARQARMQQQRQEAEANAKRAAEAQLKAATMKRNGASNAERVMRERAAQSSRSSNRPATSSRSGPSGRSPASSSRPTDHGLLNKAADVVSDAGKWVVKTAKNSFKDPEPLENGRESAKPDTGTFLVVFALAPALASAWYVAAGLIDYGNSFRGQVDISRAAASQPAR